MNVELEQRLLEKIRQMPIRRILEVEDFIDFLSHRDGVAFSLGNHSPIPSIPQPENVTVLRRSPPLSIAGGGQTLGDIVGPIVDEEDWECLK